jgi:transcription elongation GreA/GreB family factor
VNRKKQWIAECLKRLGLRRNEIVEEIEQIVSDISGETKSSAGDKHETSRALMQNQREQIGQRLKETEAMITSLMQIDPQQTKLQVESGSLVTTNKGIFMISIGYGSLTKDGTTCFFLSMQSPLGIAMKGKKKGDVFLFNNQEYMVLEVG